MKLVTKLIIVATAASFMFGKGMTLTWGNQYTNVADVLTASNSFGVWVDVNDAMAFGWEGTATTSLLKIGFAGPAGMQVRLGMNPANTAGKAITLGMSRDWWTSAGDGWGTKFSTAIDWAFASQTANNNGQFVLTMNLGFGF